MNVLRSSLLTISLLVSPLVSAEPTVQELVQGATMALQLERSPTSLTPNQRVEAAITLGYVNGFLAGAQQTAGKETAQKVTSILHQILALAHGARASGNELPRSPRDFLWSAVKQHDSQTGVKNAASEKAENEIIAIMKASIESGRIREFTRKQVETWAAGEEETIDKIRYRTGRITYQAETIFGKKRVEAKALIRDGKVFKWVYSKTGMEVR